MIDVMAKFLVVDGIPGTATDPRSMVGFLTELMSGTAFQVPRKYQTPIELRLKKGASLHLSDIVVPAGVKAVIKGRENPVVVSVVVPAAEASAVAAAETAAAAPAKGGKAPAKKK